MSLITHYNAKVGDYQMLVQEVEGAPHPTFCSKIISTEDGCVTTDFLKYELVDFTHLDTVEKIVAFINETK